MSLLYIVHSICYRYTVYSKKTASFCNLLQYLFTSLKLQFAVPRINTVHAHCRYRFRKLLKTNVETFDLKESSRSLYLFGCIQTSHRWFVFLRTFSRYNSLQQLIAYAWKKSCIAVVFTEYEKNIFCSWK